MSDYDKFVGKRIVLVRNLKTPNDKGELAVEIEGSLEAANELGVMLKPKGQVKADIIDAAEIEEIRLAPEKAKSLKAKPLKIIELGQAKSHLLERHGLTLKEVNGLTEEEAFEYHETINHVESDLGHIHQNKESAPAAQAVADEENSAA